MAEGWWWTNRCFKMRYNVYCHGDAVSNCPALSLVIGDAKEVSKWNCQRALLCFAGDAAASAADAAKAGQVLQARWPGYSDGQADREGRSGTRRWVKQKAKSTSR